MVSARSVLEMQRSGMPRRGFSPTCSTQLTLSRLAEHKTVPLGGRVAAPRQAHCLPGGLLRSQDGCGRRGGWSAAPRAGHLRPSAGPGSPQRKDLASDPAAGISPGTSEGSAWSKAAEQSSAHPGAGQASHTSSSGLPKICVQPGSLSLPSGCPPQSSPTKEPWACVHLPFGSGGMRVIRGDVLLTGGAGYSWRFICSLPLIARLASLPHLLSLHPHGI